MLPSSAESYVSKWMDLMAEQENTTVADLEKHLFQFEQVRMSYIK